MVPVSEPNRRPTDIVSGIAGIANSQFDCVDRGKDMDWYQRVENPRAEQPIQENEIQITSQGRMRNYITYAMTLLEAFVEKDWLAFGHPFAERAGLSSFSGSDNMPLKLSRNKLK
ncbi:ribonuclease P protein subunit p25-like protein [Tanacetum coccineum]